MSEPIHPVQQPPAHHIELVRGLLRPALCTGAGGVGRPGRRRFFQRLSTATPPAPAPQRLCMPRPTPPAPRRRGRRGRVASRPVPHAPASPGSYRRPLPGPGRHPTGRHRMLRPARRAGGVPRCTCAVAGSARTARHTSRPLMNGMATSRTSRSGGPAWAARTVAGPSEATCSTSKTADGGRRRASVRPGGRSAGARALAVTPPDPTTHGALRRSTGADRSPERPRGRRTRLRWPAHRCSCRSRAGRRPA
jgi:hypothetical protein